MPLFCYILLLAMLSHKAGAHGRVEEMVMSVTNNATDLPGGKKFDLVMGVIGGLKVMGDSLDFVTRALYSDASLPRPTRCNIALYVDDVTLPESSRTLTTIQGCQVEIHLDEDYLRGFHGGDLAEEITGLLYHEMTYIWQWNGQGQAPDGLLSGLGEYIRLTAGLPAPWWLFKAPGGGEQWDQGWDITARFLQYCESLKSGFVASLNAKMASGWSLQFFDQLLGHSADQLWVTYKQKYGTS